jgi:hypothetical protein
MNPNTTSLTTTRLTRQLKEFGLNPRMWLMAHEPAGPSAPVIFVHRQLDDYRLLGRLGPKDPQTTECQLQELELLSI